MEDRDYVAYAAQGLRECFPLKLIFLKRLERGGAVAQCVVLGHAVKDVNAAVVQQGRLRDGAFGAGGADMAFLERLVGDFLDRFEAVAFGALVFVKRHLFVATILNWPAQSWPMLP